MTEAPWLQPESLSLHQRHSTQNKTKSTQSIGLYPLLPPFLGNHGSSRNLYLAKGTRLARSTTRWATEPTPPPRTVSILLSTSRKICDGGEGTNIITVDIAEALEGMWQKGRLWRCRGETRDVCVCLSWKSERVQRVGEWLGKSESDEENRLSEMLWHSFRNPPEFYL